MDFSPEVLASAIVTGVFVAGVGYFLMRWRRTDLTFAQFLLLAVNLVIVRLLWRGSATGPMPIPRGQGALIVSNHRSSVEPLLIQISTDRLVHWLVAREYVEHRAMAWMFRILRSIPVGRRGVDTAATKLAIRLAQQGGLVGLFPEGRINTTDELMMPGRPGAALIALKAGVPVVPCYVEGAPYSGTALGPFFMTARVRVHIGQPMDLAPFQNRDANRELLEAFTRQMMIEIAKLAGQPDYQPRMAGKVWSPHGEEAERAEAERSVANSTSDDE